MLDGVRGPDRVFMLPNMKRNPTHAVKLRVFLAITCHVARELILPPLSVILWQNPVVGTRVPKTPVYEHGHACAGEGDVRAPRQTRVIYPVPEAAPVQFSPDQYLWSSRGARHPLHLSGNRSIKWRGAALCIHIANSSVHLQVNWNPYCPSWCM
jgi:hypothetical protein